MAMISPFWRLMLYGAASAIAGIAAFAAMILAALFILFPFGTNAPTQHFPIFDAPSPGGTWIAMGTTHVVQTMPIGGADVRSEVVLGQAARSGGVVVLEGHVEADKLIAEWLSDQELRITMPARSLIWVRLREHAGVKITLRLSEDKPDLFRAWRQEKVSKEFQPLYDDAELVAPAQ